MGINSHLNTLNVELQWYDYYYPEFAGLRFKYIKCWTSIPFYANNKLELII